MSYDAGERSRWKARIVTWVAQLPGWVSRPQRKLIAGVTGGILSSGSLQSAGIARSLKEPTGLHHTLKRLSRMPGKHSTLVWAVEDLLLVRLGAQVRDDMVLAPDPGDVNRDGSERSEYVGRVRDGSTGEWVNGYPLLSVVACDVGCGQRFPLLTRLLSSRRPGYRSENHELLQVMAKVEGSIAARPLWVIERGGDRGVLWRAGLDAERRLLVRAANQRHRGWRGTWLTAQQIAEQLPLKHQGKLTRRGQATVRFGLTRVTLRDRPEYRSTLLVVRHGAQQPLVLVTTDRARGRRQGERLIQACMDRWACEEGYRFTKQGFALEQVQARRFTTLQNLVSLATLARGLLAYYQQAGQVLMAKSKRQKVRKSLRFPFYSLLLGWQRLFAGAKTLFYDWWRAPRPKPPPIPDLFADTHLLVTR